MSHCFFGRQPESPAELWLAINAVEHACCGSLRYSGRDAQVLAQLKKLTRKNPARVKNFLELDQGQRRKARSAGPGLSDLRNATSAWRSSSMRSDLHFAAEVRVRFAVAPETVCQPVCHLQRSCRAGLAVAGARERKPSLPQLRSGSRGRLQVLLGQEPGKPSG
jgi:hypothetical protein